MNQNLLTMIESELQDNVGMYAKLTRTDSKHRQNFSQDLKKQSNH